MPSHPITAPPDRWPAFSAEALAAQGIVWLLCALTLDGGRLQMACTVTYLGWVTGVLLILARRGRGVGRADGWFVRWGWAALLAGAAPAALWYWR